MARISTAQLWVHDQDAALAFYTEKVGMEVREDVTVPEMGDFRWLTVGMPGQEEPSVVLMAVPGPPVADDDTRAAILDLTAKGMAGTLFLTTDDIQRDYDEMTARGVEFVEPPVRQPYGLDTSFRDPSGNNVRIAQRFGM